MDIDVLFDSRLFHFLRQDPVAAALIDVISDPLQDTYDVCNFILAHASIATAEGEQLELLGGLIGIHRPPAQEPKIFTLTRLGEWDDPDNDHGFFNDDDTIETGGYLVTETGLVARDGSDMTDADYRYLIRSQAASFRRRMTRVNLFNYLIAFGARCMIDDDTSMHVEIDPLDYYELTEFEKNYVVTQGFKPAGLNMSFADNTRHGDSI